MELCLRIVPPLLSSLLTLCSPLKRTETPCPLRCTHARARAHKHNARDSLLTAINSSAYQSHQSPPARVVIQTLFLFFYFYRYYKSSRPSKPILIRFAPVLSDLFFTVKFSSRPRRPPRCARCFRSEKKTFSGCAKASFLSIYTARSRDEA